MLKLLYHIVSGQKCWLETAGKVKNEIEQAKCKVKKFVLEKTGMLIDAPTHQGGNTNRGPQVDRFFSQV